MVRDSNATENAANDCSDPPKEKDECTSGPYPKSADPCSKIHEPKSDKHGTKTANADKHWLDYATACFAFIAAIGAIFAAIFSGYQGWVTRDIERRQLRAYAFPTAIGIVDYERGKIPKGVVVIRTMGQTPAYKLRGVVKMEPLPYPLRDDFDLDATPSEIQNSAFISPVNGFSLIVPAGGVLTNEDIEFFKRETGTRIYVWGRADYEDVFKSPHWLTFCYSYSYEIVFGKEIAEPCQRYNDDDHQ